MATLVKTIKSRSTNDIIYPVTKADAVYFNDNNTLVSVQGKINTIQGLLGSSSISNVGSSITGIIGNEALTTTAQTLAGAINEHQTDISTLNNNLTQLQRNRTSSSGVSLKSYTNQSNPYVFPCDGYVMIDSGSSAQAGTHIWVPIRSNNGINVANLYMYVQASFQTLVTFVKKGMHTFLYEATATNNFTVIFHPLDGD